MLLAVRGLGARLCRRDRSGTGWATIFGRALDRTGTIFILALAAKLVDGYAQPPELFKQTIDFIFVIASVIQVAVWVREIILGFIEHRTGAGEHEALGSALGIIRLLVTIALFAIAAIVILDNLGVNVTGLVAGLGIGGIAIGLAAQGIFADLFAALSILFDRPFRRGDSIAYDTTSASVEAIGLKSTRLRAITGEQRIISNKNLLDKEIRNNSRLLYRRGKFALGVVYQLDPARAADLPGLLREIVEAQGQQFVRAGFVGFGASSLNFEVEFDVASADYQDFYNARHAIGMAILKRFNDEKIDLAYPTQTTFTAAPDGRMIMPYPDVQKVAGVEPVPPAPPRT
ncbi:putative small conductance mechanosensitive channel [Sphingomonas changbaiensis NBRC 104936]|uniref:Putative small conductance mechanosensitive channel n=1 Tax=Sphingomonas changbaiensis NBRC 104936 TaxID=1219043 RepID=A0A0E9MPZ7_9SPHN|nr:putative small conductance mechanosensitive channel [Sphingomonas changbaiensis NBRC 104936]